MPVAVRLVEALALVTLMAMITCVSLGVVLAQRALSLTITFIEVPDPYRFPTPILYHVYIDSFILLLSLRQIYSILPSYCWRNCWWEHSSLSSP